jgi:hypothetical protein
MTPTLTRLGLILALACAPAALQADTPAPKPERDLANLSYAKPENAKEKVREIAMVSRSNGPRVTMMILTPDHVARTVQTAPSIFWYQSEAIDAPGVVTVTQPGEPEPLLELKIDGKSAGIRRVDLSKHALKLEPGVEYRVAVALYLNGAPAAEDPVTRSIMQRIEPPQTLVAQLLNKADKIDRAFVFAQEGIWFDALTAISDQIESNQDDKSLHKYRAALLRAGQLDDVAEYEMQMAR